MLPLSRFIGQPPARVKMSPDYRDSPVTRSMQRCTGVGSWKMALGRICNVSATSTNSARPLKGRRKKRSRWSRGRRPPAFVGEKEGTTSTR